MKPDFSEVEPAQSQRPAELEDWLNRHVYHPLSWRLAMGLRYSPVSPNAVSVVAGLCVVIAAIIYGSTHSPVWACLALLVHMTWHVLDGADGDLARLTGRVSDLGEIIDGASDYIGHLCLYLTLAMVMAEHWGVAGFILMVCTGFARAVQAVFFETQRRQYMWWVYDKAWVRMRSSQAPSNAWSERGPLRLYLWLSAALAAGGERLDEALKAVPDERKVACKAIIKTQFSVLFARLSILSANYRTLVIGAAMIAKAPWVIVGFELGFLSLVLIVTFAQTRGRIAAIVDQLSSSKAR